MITFFFLPWAEAHLSPLIDPSLYGTIWFCMNFHAIGWLLVVSKPRVLLGFHPNPKILKSKVGKFLKGTRSIRNPLFEDGFIVK